MPNRSTWPRADERVASPHAGLSPGVGAWTTCPITMPIPRPRRLPLGGSTRPFSAGLGPAYVWVETVNEVDKESGGVAGRFAYETRN